MLSQSLTQVSESDLFHAVDWDQEKFGVGVGPIDDQHKMLLKIINDLCHAHNDLWMELEDTVMSKKAKDANRPPIDRRINPLLHRGGGRIASCLDQLVSYCVHLTVEEHKLDSYGYTDLGPHRQDHEAFQREICRAHRLMESYNFERVDLCRLMYFLKQWMVDHISKDRRYAHLLVDKGVSQVSNRTTTQSFQEASVW